MIIAVFFFSFLFQGFFFFEEKTQNKYSFQATRQLAASGDHARVTAIRAYLSETSACLLCEGMGLNIMSELWKGRNRNEAA